MQKLNSSKREQFSKKKHFTENVRSIVILNKQNPLKPSSKQIRQDAKSNGSKNWNSFLHFNSKGYKIFFQ